MQRIPIFVVGPLARSADDLELALEVLTTPNRENEGDGKPKLLPARRHRFKDYRVAVWLTDPYPRAEIDAEVFAVLQKTVAKLRAAGLQIDEHARPDVRLSESAEIWKEIYNKMRMGSLPDDLVEKQKRQQAMWAAFFERYDVLLAPVAPTVAFPHDHKGITLLSRTLMINGHEKPMTNCIAWEYMATVSGLPATVAPVGLSDSGLPVGIQIIGARLEDRTTIGFARGLSELVGGFRAPPGYQD